MAQPKIPVNLIMSRLAESAETAGARTQKASDVLLGELDTQIATTPHEIVYQEDRIKLKHYRPPGKVRIKTPLLLVYALINRETMLDLQPERSVVQNFMNEGIDLYMIDWGYPTRKDKFLTIDDHVNGYMDNVIDFILARHNLDKINLMGICMGGAFSVIYAALHPEKVKNLVTTVTPTNFDTEQGLLHIWMKDLDVDRMVDAHGNMPGDLLNFGFLLLKALGMKGVSILLLNEDTDEMDLVASHGLSEAFLNKGPLSAEKSVVQALKGDTVAIRDATTDKRIQYRKEMKKEGIVSMLSAPIKSQEKVIGVMRLFSGVEREFPEDMIIMVNALAHQGALAIRNASMYMMLQNDMNDLKDELWSHRSWF